MKIQGIDIPMAVQKEIMGIMLPRSSVLWDDQSILTHSIIKRFENSFRTYFPCGISLFRINLRSDEFRMFWNNSSTVDSIVVKIFSRLAENTILLVCLFVLQGQLARKKRWSNQRIWMIKNEVAYPWKCVYIAYEVRWWAIIIAINIVVGVHILYSV